MLRFFGFPLTRERFSDAGGPAGIYEETLPLAAASTSSAAAAPSASSSSGDNSNGNNSGSLVVRMLRQADETLFGGGGGSSGDDQATRRPGGGSGAAAASAPPPLPPPPPAVVELSAASGVSAAKSQPPPHHFSASVVAVNPPKPAVREANAAATAAAATTAAATPAAAASSSSSSSRPSSSSVVLPVVYGLANLSSVVAIVVANKLALKTHGFSFPVALTWCHTAFTACGMLALARLGFFEPKRPPVPKARSAPVAFVYVSFLVLNNLSIQLNTVGFYQVSKIAITPVIVAIERLCYGKRASPRVLAATAVLLSGVLLCSVSDSQVAAAPLAALVAAANVLVSALYQVWASTKQRELGVDGMQLLHQIAPPAVLMLGVMVPLLEPVGWGSLFRSGGGGAAGAAAAATAATTTAGAATTAARPTLVTFEYTAPALFWIGLSSVLGLVVTATTFLFIGATSSLTYNVVGHLKTVGIVSAGVLFFREALSARRLLGLALAMSGIVWYSQVKMQEQAQEQEQAQQQRARAVVAEEDGGARRRGGG